MPKLISRHDVANTDWRLWKNDDGTFINEQVRQSILMDIRDELQKLNQVMQCLNVAKGFQALAALQHNEKAFKRRVAAAVRRKLKERK